MPPRRLLARKGLHPLTERCTDSQQNCYAWEQPVSDSPRHHFPPINYVPRILEAGLRAGPFLAVWRNSSVTEAQKNPAALDSVRDCLFDPIDGIGRGNRLANAAGPDHLDQVV
jgi:hypothetical protein